MCDKDISTPVRYFCGDDDDKGHAALVTDAHEDGSVCLVYYCTATHAWKEASRVKPLAQSNGDTNEPYFLRVGESTDSC
jgi:replicative superfamily II helicase